MTGERLKREIIERQATERRAAYHHAMGALERRKAERRASDQMIVAAWFARFNAAQGAAFQGATR